MKRSTTAKLAAALDILALDIESPDDVPALCLREAAERLREYESILDYWRDVEKTEPDFQQASEASIDPARENFFQKIRQHYGQPLPKEPPVLSNP